MGEGGAKSIYMFHPRLCEYCVPRAWRARNELGVTRPWLSAWRAWKAEGVVEAARGTVVILVVESHRVVKAHYGKVALRREGCSGSVQELLEEAVMRWESKYHPRVQGVC